MINSVKSFEEYLFIEKWNNIQKELNIDLNELFNNYLNLKESTKYDRFYVLGCLYKVLSKLDSDDKSYIFESLDCSINKYIGSGSNGKDPKEKILFYIESFINTKNCCIDTYKELRKTQVKEIREFEDVFLYKFKIYFDKLIDDEIIVDICDLILEIFK